jgi:hypothetical protein
MINIGFIITIILSIVLVEIFIWGITYRPIPAPVKISTISKGVKKSCTRDLTTCVNDTDCQETCSEQYNGIEMGCTTISVPKGQNTYQSQSVCTPKNATPSCDTTYGGINTWAGWSGVPTMGWDCLCAYPAYAATKDCAAINPGICMGPEPTTNKADKAFTWTIASGKAPDASFCNCPSGTTKIVTDVGSYPICVPTGIQDWYSSVST